MVCGRAVKQIFTSLVATFPTFMYGIQIGWLSPMKKILQSSEGPTSEPLTDNTISWMAAALPLSAIAGIPFFSFASDKFGRKPCIVLVSTLFSISWLLKLTSKSVPLFILARVSAGIAAGGSFVVIPVYIKEISHDSLRGALGSLVMTVCKIGVITVYAMGMLFNYEVNQATFLGLSLIHAVCFIFMPESPNFLIKRGNIKQATKTISWLRNVHRDDQEVMDEVVKLKQEQRMIESMPAITAMSIIKDKPTSSALRMTLILMAIQTLSGCFALMNYASDVFNRAGTTWSPDSLALLVGSLQLAGSFFTTMSVERFGRKIPLISSSLALSICMATLATYFLIRESMHVPSWLPVVSVCVCMFAYGAGLAPVPFVIMAEVFGFEVRSRMAGASMICSFLCSSCTVLFYSNIANLLGPHVVFYAFSLVGLFGAVYTVLCVPETKGKTLSEIQRFWK